MEKKVLLLVALLTVVLIINLNAHGNVIKLARKTAPQQLAAVPPLTITLDKIINECSIPYLLPGAAFPFENPKIEGRYIVYSRYYLYP